jgi:hypothetical protein
MMTYRAYQLDQRHKIRAGEWILAEDDAAAREQAAELCDEGVDSIELWRAQTKVDELDCPPGDPVKKSR